MLYEVITQGVAETAQAQGMLGAALGKLFALAENYPDLKANVITSYSIHYTKLYDIDANKIKGVGKCVDNLSEIGVHVVVRSF